MTSVGFGVALAALVAGVLAAALALRPSWTSGSRGWLLSFLGLFLLPVAVTWAGVSVHLEEAKSTEFCLSCHEMQPYGASLRADRADWLPASHYQNRRVSRDTACYDCHTDYTMFGDVSAKLRGAKHVWVHYFGDIPPTGEIELYTPYQNRECLHCHGGARVFEESILHADILGELERGEVSCLDCHGEVHHVTELDGVETWEPAPRAATAEMAEGGES